MSDAPGEPVDSREAGKGPSDIPEESVSSESELKLSDVVEKRREEGKQDT